MQKLYFLSEFQSCVYTLVLFLQRKCLTMEIKLAVGKVRIKLVEFCFWITAVFISMKSFDFYLFFLFLLLFISKWEIFSNQLFRIKISFIPQVSVVQICVQNGTKSIKCKYDLQRTCWLYNPPLLSVGCWL